MNLLETTIANLDHASDIPLYSVALRRIPAHYVISVRGIIETPDKESELWKKLAQERKRQEIQFANPAWNISVFHDEGFQERADVPKMIFLGQGSIGKREYEFWKEIIGYEIISGEGKCFRTTWREICELLDQEIPTILFGLDC